MNQTFQVLAFFQTTNVLPNSIATVTAVEWPCNVLALLFSFYYWHNYTFITIIYLRCREC